jgi:hypothetical protein
VDFLKAILVIFAALVVHVLVGLFGGYLFSHEEQQASKRDVEIVTESVEKENEEKPEEQRPQDEIKEQDEAPPDPESGASHVEAPSSSDDAPALDAASLSAIPQSPRTRRPKAGGNPLLAAAQARLMTRLRAAQGLTMILVSHNLAVIAHMCDRLAVMNRGVVVEEMDVATLRQENPREAYTRQLLLASKGYDREAALRMVTYD